MVSSSKPREVGYWSWKWAAAKGARARVRRGNFILRLAEGGIRVYREEGRSIGKMYRIVK
jgi:hypothetical protein